MSTVVFAYVSIFDKVSINILTVFQYIDYVPIDILTILLILVISKSMIDMYFLFCFSRMHDMMLKSKHFAVHVLARHQV